MGVAGAISRIVMFGANTTEVHGLDRFLELLDRRREVAQRERGLVTGLPFCAPEVDDSLVNPLYSIEPYQRVRTYHKFSFNERLLRRSLKLTRNLLLSVDDPFMWGALPFKYAFDPGNHRWSLGSYDICFTNKYGPAIRCTLSQINQEP